MCNAKGSETKEPWIHPFIWIHTKSWRELRCAKKYPSEFCGILLGSFCGILPTNQPTDK